MSSNQPVVDALKDVLADNYALYLKTQNFHWNVEGPNFRGLHLLFEEQYRDLTTAIDTVAELIRGLGEKAPGAFDAYARRTSIKPGDENASAEQMVAELCEARPRSRRRSRLCLKPRKLRATRWWPASRSTGLPCIARRPGCSRAASRRRQSVEEVQ